MSNKDRIAIFPSRANNVMMKTRLQSANKGLSMLRKKRDALELKLRDLVQQRKENAANSLELFKGAIFSIAKANFLDTDLKPGPIIGSVRADAFMRMSSLKTVGLALPSFVPVIRKSESLPLTGLSRGGHQVTVIREKFQELLRILVILASHDYSIKMLKEAIRATNTRVNGLEYVIIPRFMNTSAYIINELDEMEREEFYRLKRSQAKQRHRKLKRSQEQQGPVEKVEAEEAEEVQELGKGMVHMPKDFADASTSTNLMGAIISIYRKKTMESRTQTLISGHYPASKEFISPTDSLISGASPSIGKRTSFLVTEMDAKKQLLAKNESNESETENRPTKTISDEEENLEKS